MGAMTQRPSGRMPGAKEHEGIVKNHGVEGGSDLRQEARWLLLIALMSIALGLVWDALFGWLFPLEPEGIREWLRGWGAWAPLIYIALLTAAVVISPLPSVPLDIAAGLAFGLAWGTVYTLVGAELGAIIAFALARRLGRPWVSRRLPAATLARIDRFIEQRGVAAILLMRLLPVFNFDWVSYAAGLTAIAFPAFAIATLIGMIPPVVAIVAVGATLPDRPAVAGLIFAGLVLAALFPLLAPWLIPGFRHRRGFTNHSERSDP